MPYEQFIEDFSAHSRRRGLELHGAQSLVVPYFTSEFNRLVEHEEINNVVSGAPSPLSRGWFEIAPVCRLKDATRVESGNYLSVFEMLTSIRQFNDSSEAAEAAVDDAVRLLCADTGLDARRLVVTYFGGGEILPGVQLPPADEWAEAWRRHGIPDSQVCAVKGPKNYLLFVGESERAGPKCEIIYRGESCSLEVGTLIVDSQRVIRSRAGWGVEASPTVVGGGAFGAERLFAVANGASDLWRQPPMASPLRACESFVSHPAGSRSLFDGDLRVIVDHLRTALFLQSFGGADDRGQARNRARAMMLRRVRRKSEAAQLEPLREALETVCRSVADGYASRYPSLASSIDGVVSRVLTLPWPETWNADSYSPTAPKV